MAYVYEHGAGTSADPYQIWTAADLNGVREYLSAHYIQMADIDLSGYSNWEPIAPITYIAEGYWAQVYFTGSYNGNNFTISNININTSVLSGVGLFGYTRGATFKDTHLQNIHITTYHKEIINELPRYQYAGEYVGALIGYAENSNVENCSAIGTLNCYGGESIGGLIGYFQQDEYDNDFIIKDSFASVDINCFFTTDIIEGFDVIGGFIGSSSSNSLHYADESHLYIYDCYATGNIVMIGEDASYYNTIQTSGGFIGEFWSGYIDRCYATGNVHGHWLSGGFFGEADDYIVSNCYARGNVSLPLHYFEPRDYGDFGGFAGGAYGEPESLINCYSTGSVPLPTATIYDVAGFQPYGNNAMINCFYDYTLCPVSDPVAIPKTTAEMKTQSTFIGWDFTDTWGIVTDSYPYLLSLHQPLQTGKDYVLVTPDESGSMVFNGQNYKFVRYLERFEKTTHESAEQSATYAYGGNSVTYNEQSFVFLASGITDLTQTGGFGTYTADTSRTVQSSASHEMYVNFYYIEASTPTVTTVSIEDETLNGFKVNINITDTGGLPITACGFAWGTAAEPVAGTDITVELGPKEAGEYEASYGGDAVLPDTAYNVRAFAVNEIGIAYGDVLSFSIASQLPTVITGAVSNLSETGFSTTISVTDLGSKTVNYGFVWGESVNPMAGIDTTVPLGSASTPLDHRVTYNQAIEADKEYHIRGYATNSVGTNYGADIAFTLDSNFEWSFIATPVHDNLLEMKGGGTYHLSEAQYNQLQTILSEYIRLELLTNGDKDNPELLFTPDGDIIEVEVN